VIKPPQTALKLVDTLHVPPCAVVVEPAAAHGTGIPVSLVVGSVVVAVVHPLPVEFAQPVAPLDEGEFEWSVIRTLRFKSKGAV
jgi:hypothetical protein